MGNENLTPRGKIEYSIGYGNFLIAQSQGRSVARKKYEFQILQQKKSFMSLISIMKSIQIATIVQIQNVNQQMNYVEVDYQYFEYTLRDEVEKRRQNRIWFTESQIIGLMDCILSGLMALQYKNINFNDLRPQRVFIAIQQHKPIFKLALPLLFNNKALSQQFFQSGYSDKAKMYYMSPEVLCQLDNPHNAGFNLEKNDVFSLGMTVLEMVCLSPLDDCYDYAGYKIKHRQISKKIYSTDNRYSSEFINVLQEMLADNPKARIHYEALFQKLQQLIFKNEDQINKKGSQIYCSRKVTDYQERSKKTSNKKNQSSYSRAKGIQLFKNQTNNKVEFSMNKTRKQRETQTRSSYNRNLRAVQRSGVKRPAKSSMVQSQLLLDSIYISQDAQARWKSFNQ